MKTFNLLAALTAVLLTSGCATMFGDDVQTISLQSDKSATLILTDGAGSRSVEAPGAAVVQKGDIKARYRVEGCELDKNINRKVAKPFWLNFLSGGPVGSGIDYLTGAMWEYDSVVVVDSSC